MFMYHHDEGLGLVGLRVSEARVQGLGLILFLGSMYFGFGVLGFRVSDALNPKPQTPDPKP